MLKLNSSPEQVAAVRLPTGTLLGVSWLHGRFSVIALQRGALGVAWTCPTPVNTPKELTTAIREAVRRTSYQGSQLSLVLAHAQFVQHWVDVPAGKSSQLNKFLKRQVQQHKSFAGTAAWSFQLTVPTKATGGALLHLMPLDLYTSIVDACTDAGLHLVTLTSHTEVMRAQLRQLPLRDDEIALVATTVGQSTSVLVARGDGMPLLARSVQGDWKTDQSRVAVDLNRTLLYAQQQFGVAVANVWLNGEDIEARLPALAGFFEVPLKAHPAPSGEFSWAEEALRLSGETPINLISREHREAPARRAVMRLSVYSAIALLVVAFGLSGYVHFYYREESRAIKRLTALEQDLQTRHHQLQDYFAEVDRKGQFLQVARPDRPDPVATWVLGSLSEAVPTDLVVTNLTVLSETNQWRVTIGGIVQPAAVEAGRDDVRRLTRQLARNLSQGALGMEFEGDLAAPLEPAGNTNRPPPAPAAGTGVAADAFNAWTTRLKDLAITQTSKAREFTLQGIMR